MCEVASLTTSALSLILTVRGNRKTFLHWLLMSTTQLLLDSQPSHLGAENWFYNMLALRVGYSFSQGENPKNGLTAGFGLRRIGEASLENVNFQFDYAFVPDQAVGNAHRVSLLLRF